MLSQWLRHLAAVRNDPARETQTPRRNGGRYPNAVRAEWFYAFPR